MYCIYYFTTNLQLSNVKWISLNIHLISIITPFSSEFVINIDKKSVVSEQK